MGRVPLEVRDEWPSVFTCDDFFEELEAAANVKLKTAHRFAIRKAVNQAFSRFLREETRPSMPTVRKRLQALKGALVTTN